MNATHHIIQERSFLKSEGIPGKHRKHRPMQLFSEEGLSEIAVMAWKRQFMMAVASSTI